MTWLKGTSTWGALTSDLTRLICGEIADGNSVTNAVGSRWVREVSRTVTDGVLNATTTVTSATANFVAADVGACINAVGVPAGATIVTVTNSSTVTLSVAATAVNVGVTLQICTDTIRTPAAKDVASGAMSNRTGYYSLIGNGANDQAPHPLWGNRLTVAKVVNPYTSNPSTGFGRWVVSLRVTTANSVSGNYSTAVVSSVVWDGDAGTQLSSSSYTPSAAGVVTLTNGHTVSITDPSGFLASGTQFVRAFTSTYVYGIDYWPMLYRAAAAATFSVAPPGVAGTDYDIVTLATNQAGTTGEHSAGSYGADRSNFFHGLGIKTATGLGSSPLYTVSFPMALIKCRMFNSATNGIVSLDVGQSLRDAVGAPSTFRCVGGFRITNWAKCFQTAGSVTSSSAVQYFMSVTNDGIVLVLNGDTGATGKLGFAHITTFTPTEPTYDVFPVAFSVVPVDYTADTTSQLSFYSGTQYPYHSMRRRQEAGLITRDWQTGWMRAEHLSIFFTAPFFGGQHYVDQTGMSQSVSATTGSSAVPQLMALAMPSYNAAASVASIPIRQNKPSIDGKWWLYSYLYGEYDWDPANLTTNLDRIVRGSHSRFFYIPGDSWGQGDELTDSVSGAKYLLLMPDYAGGAGRIRLSTNSFAGGVAVAEL